MSEQVRKRLKYKKNKNNKYILCILHPIAVHIFFFYQTNIKNSNPQISSTFQQTIKGFQWKKNFLKQPQFIITYPKKDKNKNKKF